MAQSNGSVNIRGELMKQYRNNSNSPNLNEQSFNTTNKHEQSITKHDQSLTKDGTESVNNRLSTN